MRINRRLIRYDVDMTILSEKQKWELAGFTRETGIVGRPLKSGLLHVPAEIRLNGERLVWASSSHTEVAVSDLMFDQFLNLSDADSDSIFRYAKRWGPIGFCKHNLPSTHNLGWATENKIVGFCDPRGWPDRCWELIFLWRKFSRQARAMLNIGARLREGKPGVEEDWKLFDRWEYTELGESVWKWRLPPQRAFLSREINTWLLLGDVGVGLTLRKDDYSFSLQYHPQLGLFGALACQLALAITRAEGLAICSACGRAYAPPRKPNPDLRNYCRSCGRRAAMRDASRDYRRRIKQAIARKYVT